jgi:hypothetical protein
MSCAIPRPVQLVIDDVGWREGWDLSADGGPYRAGVDRLLGPADYAAVAELGATLGIRPQCAMVVCEWDRQNACADYPTTTFAGRAWDNRERLGPWLDRSIAVIRDQAAHFEFALHGVGHEHWENGDRTRAEWFGGSLHERWSPKVLASHAECFRRIMRQNGLGGPGGAVRLPVSFVPCAFRYLWDEGDPQSTGAFLSAQGVRYASTPFSACTFAHADLPAPDGGFDHDLFVLDRGNVGIRYDLYDTVPQTPIPNSICGIHWPNLLRPDPAENGESVARWCAYLGSLRADAETMLARTMPETVSQWFHWRFSSLHEDGDGWCLDLSGLPKRARELGLILPVVVKHGRDVAAVADNCAVLASWRRDEWGFSALWPRDAETGRFRLVAEPQTGRLLEPGTCDLLGMTRYSGGVALRVRAYGHQELVWAGGDPAGVSLASNALCLENLTSDGANLRLALCGDPIHGSEGELTMAGEETR